MADENKPAFYPRVGRNIAKNFRSAQPPAFIEDPRAMDLPQYGDIDLSVPSRENLEMARRMAERDAQLRRQAEADRSPLEKLAGGVQAGRFLGSALTQAINSAPTRLFKGDEAADKFMQERMYKPEQPLAYEYAGDVGDFLEKLETQYKIPPVLPEAVALQYLAGPATSQAIRAAGKGAVKAGMALERGMEPVVKGALERGGLPREMAMAMGANTQSNILKKPGKWFFAPNEPTPGIIVPGKINNVREAVRNIKGNYGARRVERAADEIPNLERMFQEDALKEAFTGDNASAMMTINPADFEKFARELETRSSVSPKMAELAKQGDIDKMTVPTDEYLKYLQSLKQGFSDVPYLNLTKDEVGLPAMPQVIGHEGRHRNRALADIGEQSALVKINPRGDLREGMPRMTQDDFIEALREELERSNRMVLPEKSFSNIAQKEIKRPPVKLPDVYADGGKVAISNNPDTMMLEVNNQKMKNGVPAYAGGKAVTKMGLKAAASEAERSLPLRLTRAMPKPLSEINAHAERVARQMMGEHVTSGKPKDTTNLAGRSMKESQRVKGLEYELVPTKDVPESQVVEARLGDINIALPGDFTLSDVELKSLQGEPVGSRQQGGSRYGLGHMEAEVPLFYASNEGPAQMVQNKATDLAALFNPERVMGHHMAMGPVATNFAQHFADANMRYIDYSKLRPADMYQFDKIVSEGFVTSKKDKKTGETVYKVVDFPDWPGIADPEAALAAMEKNPEMRKWYNRVMQTPKITSPLNLPSGLDVRYAITSPDLRDMEVNLTGHGVGELVPGAPLTDTAQHATYSKGIPGMYRGHQEVLTPFAISFPDAAQHIISTQRPQDFTGTIQKVFPHQLVDQQYLDELGAYRKRIKELTGKKKGGTVHKAAGGAITGDDLIIEERPL